MTETYAVGIAGTGAIAKKAHLPFWCRNDGVRLDAMADVEGPALKEAHSIAEEIGGSQPTRWTDAEEMIKERDLDIVDVTIPAGAQKYETIRTALEAGCHVTAQKPFVDNLAKGEELAQLAEENDRVLSVNQQARYAGAFSRAMELIDEGKIGMIRSVRISSDFQFSGTGRWLRHGVHGIDLVRYWTGENPTAVAAWHKRQTVDDRYLFATWLDFEGPLVAEIWDELSSSTTLSWSFRISGTDGTIEGREAYFEGMKRPRVVFTPAGESSGVKEEIEESYVPTAFDRYFKRFLNAIDGRFETPCAAADNVETVRIALASKQASEIGSWVDPKSISK